jgi:hypothetical protein
MDFTSINDSFSMNLHEPDECPHCCSVVRVHHNGLCLGCLVQAGLTDDECCEGDNLDALLSEIE